MVEGIGGRGEVQGFGET